MMGYVFMLPLWILVIVGAVWMLKAIFLIRKGNTTGRPSLTPREILEYRYSRGDITREQYQRMLEDISTMGRCRKCMASRETRNQTDYPEGCSESPAAVYNQSSAPHGIHPRPDEVYPFFTEGFPVSHVALPEVWNHNPG